MTELRLEGHIHANPAPKTSRRTSKRWETNDGRAPDTFNDLVKSTHTTTKEHSTTTKKPSTSTSKPSNTAVTSQAKVSTPTVLTPSMLATNAYIINGYQWSNNSCFIDAGHELLFHAFLHWTPHQRSSFLDLFTDKSVPLYDVFYHFENRLKWTRSESTALDTASFKRDGKRVLGLAQSKLRHWITSRWSLYKEGEFGDGVIWMPKLFEVRIT